MKSKQLLLLLYLLFVTQMSNAQNKDEQSNFVSIGTTPFNLIEPITGTFETVVELKFTPRISIEGKLGVPAGPSTNSDSRFKSNKYTEYKLGSKLRFKDVFHHDRTGYVGIEYVHMTQNVESLDDWYTKDEPNYIQYGYESADITRVINGVRLNIGVIIPLGKLFLLEIYNGIGARHSDTAFKTVNEFIKSDDLIAAEQLELNLLRKQQNRYLPDYVLGLKLAVKVFTY